jgi:hypothetical protein
MRLALSKTPSTQIYKTRGIKKQITLQMLIKHDKRKKIILPNHISAIYRKTLLYQMEPKVKEVKN